MLKLHKEIEAKHVYERLLKYGLFANKMDGLFSSFSFYEWLKEEDVDIFKQKRTELLKYRVLKNDNSIRIFSIPNPSNYFCLCKCITDNWSKIKESSIIFNNVDKYIETSLMSIYSNDFEDRLIPLNTYDFKRDEQEIVLKKSFGKKFIAEADISNCFHSIYTHSISWALVGKDIAKEKQYDKDCWFNLIDKCVRNCQDKETIGIPIGPNTSNLFAELVLSKIDEVLLSKKYNYVRFIDDYRCFCATREEANCFIKDLSVELNKFRLSLNNKKTGIREFPYALEKNRWVIELRNFMKNINTVDEDNILQVIDYIDMSINLFERDADNSIRYALKTVNTKSFSSYSVYKKIFNYFMNINFLYPSSLDLFAKFYEKGLELDFKKEELEILKKDLVVFIEKAIEEHLSYHRSDAITWLFYLSIVHNLDIKDFSCDVLKTQDCVPVLFSYLYNKKKGKNVDKYIELAMDSESDFWIFIYELYRFESLKKDDCKYLPDYFKKMKKDNVSFLDKKIVDNLKI